MAMIMGIQTAKQKDGKEEKDEEAEAENDIVLSTNYIGQRCSILGFARTRGLSPLSP